MVSNHSLSIPSTQSPKKRNSKQKSDSITNGVAKTNDDANKKLNRLNIELFPQNVDNNLAESEINNDNLSDSIPQFTVPSSDSSSTLIFLLFSSSFVGYILINLKQKTPLYLQLQLTHFLLHLRFKTKTILRSLHLTAIWSKTKTKKVLYLKKKI